MWYNKIEVIPYFYPRPPRGGRHNGVGRHQGDNGISTHALREEGDAQAAAGSAAASAISTHALREEGDRPPNAPNPWHPPFLPTPSARRATLGGGHCLGLGRFLPTPSARRATGQGVNSDDPVIISTHALREEGDPGPWKEPVGGSDFYPRPPRGGRLT